MRQAGNRQQSAGIDVQYLLRVLFRNALIIILCGWMGAVWGFMFAGYLRAPIYTSRSYMLIVNKENPDALISETTITKISSQYQKTFTSKVMESTVADILGKTKLNGSLSAGVATGTNILVVSASASDPMEAFAIVRAAVDNYMTVTDYVITDYVLEEIYSPYIPVYASNASGRLRITLLGGLAGLFLSAGLIVLIALLRDDVKSEDQLSQVLDTERFATLYYEKKTKRHRKEGLLISLPYTSFLFRETIGKMATRFDYAAQQDRHKVFMITSVMENEGKSTVAANLALALAEQNKTVLLIDGDLKKPSLHKLMEKTVTEEMEIGEYLLEKSSLQDVLTKEKESGLLYLFGTKSYRDSDKMLSSDRMKDLIRIARNHVDYIIMDTAPMSLSSDAEILNELADAALLVVRQEYARVPAINDALDRLRQNSTEVMGCVFNGVHTRLIPRSTEYGYGYNYRYGYYGYGRSENKK